MACRSTESRSVPSRSKMAAFGIQDPPGRSDRPASPDVYDALSRLPLRPGRRLFRGGILRLLALDRHQHFLLTGRRLALLGGFLRSRRFRYCSAAHAPPQRLHQVDHILALRPFLRPDDLASALLIDEVDQRGLIVVLEFFGLEAARLLADDVLGEIEHVLRDVHVLDLVEIFIGAAHFVRVAQQRADQSFFHRLERDDVLAGGEHHAADRDLVHLTDGLTDHREGVVADLSIWAQVVWPDQITRVDLGLLDELVDVDRTRGFQRNLIELFLRHFDELILFEHVALYDVLVGHFLAGVGVHLGVLDPVTGLAVELVERNLLALGGRGVQRHGTGDEGQTQEAFPVGAGGHVTQNSGFEGGSDSRRMRRPGSDTVPGRHHFRLPPFCRLDICSCYVLMAVMNDRPASWRMPTPKQMEKLARAPSGGLNRQVSPAVGPSDGLPDEYWQAVLDDASADARPGGSPRIVT